MFKRTRAATAAICGVAALAFVGLASGVTYAATETTPGTITVAAHDTSLTSNAEGAAEAAASAGLSLFVRSDETGKMYQHSAGVTVKRDKPYLGVYIVTFKQNISKCAAVVSQGETSGNGFIPGTFYEAVVQSDRYNTGNPHQVYVYATNTAGDSVNAGFDLIVAC